MEGRMQRVKIVATLGPASDSPEVIRQLMTAGMDVVRLNFSHGEHELHRRVYETVREEARKLGLPIAILADLQGPKIRVGRMCDGALQLESGAELALTSEDVLGVPGRVSTSYSSLPDDVRVGDPILLDDGKLRLTVLGVKGREVQCRVEVGGRLSDRKGINLPGSPLSTPALTEKDRTDIAFARELGVDFLALSFVRSPQDVVEAKQLAGDIPVIAKIEKPEAVDAHEAIADAADGLMVARGDLGVEVGAEKVPLIQKHLIRDASRRGEPVIVATQMLESMINSPVPTRAEVSDVANAVLDGCDAVMLSGETAVGAYPVEAVRHMSAVIEEIESSELFQLRPAPKRINEGTFSNAIAAASVNVTQDLELRALVVFTQSGRTAKLVSSYRPMTQLIALSRHDQVLRRLNLCWGVRPVKVQGWITDLYDGIEEVEDLLLEGGLVDRGDDVAVTFGMRDLSDAGRTSILKLWKIRGEG
ncbi:MAG: pyruvate kinase [bacterium]|nr:pyruvate kinase [bacterium]